MAFPENYDQGVKWLLIDRLDRKELQEYFVTRAALLAARASTFEIGPLRDSLHRVAKSRETAIAPSALKRRGE